MITVENLEVKAGKKVLLSIPHFELQKGEVLGSWDQTAREKARSSRRWLSWKSIPRYNFSKRQGHYERLVAGYAQKIRCRDATTAPPRYNGLPKCRGRLKASEAPKTGSETKGRLLAGKIPNQLSCEKTCGTPFGR